MKQQYVVCISNDGYPESLELFKIYRCLPTTPLEAKRGLIRVVDETGEDYLFSSRCFKPNPVSLPVRRAMSLESLAGVRSREHRPKAAA